MKTKQVKGITAEFLTALAVQDGFTTMHYKIMLLLMSGNSYTQAQIAEKLGVKHRQNLTVAMNALTQQGYIVVDRWEGRNKFVKVDLNRKLSEPVDPQQMTLDETL